MSDEPSDKRQCYAGKGSHHDNSGPPRGASKGGDVSKLTDKHQAFRSFRKGDELILVKGGKRAYIWCRSGEKPIWGAERPPAIVSGPATLRKLALAILKEVDRGEPR